MGRIAMKLSFLIPSKDRLDLLKHTVHSIFDQDDPDVEVIIVDNSSTESYAGYVAELSDRRVIFYRQPRPVSVTENWTRALSLCTGDYFIMLGDDDAIAPNFVETVREILYTDTPDILYLAAFHYCYPNVIPSSPAGYLTSVLNSEFFGESAGPFCLMPSYARELACSVPAFRYRYGLNAQHFLLRTSFARRFETIGGFYQSPYPDTFSSVAAFLHAELIIVMPVELVLIGISPKSFGGYYFSGRTDAGYRFLDNINVSSEIRAALKQVTLPGDLNNTNWLIAVAAVRHTFPLLLTEDIALHRYRILQIVSVLRDRYLGSMTAEAYSELRSRLTASETTFFDALDSIMRTAVGDMETMRQIFLSIEKSIGQYYPAKLRELELGSHETIWDAYLWLKTAKLRRLGPPSHVTGRSSPRFRSLLQLIRPSKLPRTVAEPRSGVAATASTLPHIAINRRGRRFIIEMKDFDEFKFVSGDSITIEPSELGDQLLRTPDGHRHISIPGSLGIRVPSNIKFVSFKNFSVPEHLIMLTGAGFESFDSLGKAHIDNYNRFMGLKSDMTFLEVGSGIGRDAFQLIDIIGPAGKYIGIDVQRESILWCQKNITARFPNFLFYHFNAYHELHNPLSTKSSGDFTFPIAARSVDRIALGSVFTHIFSSEIAHYLREIARVLKPDGLAYATFFLYDEKVVMASRNNNVTPYNLRFEHAYGDGCYINDPQFPTGAVAYTDEAMKRMISESGLRLARPYLKGLWSGFYSASEADDGQDVALLRI
jgi:glycosyltransferase involved in cell wall biosynthesis/SAM-dependent methyltransferase